ncbi:hypothetical protein MPSEU_000665000 [Mayamaea pseudoterrestris]|nr:hypothetical protein MPSEU_000665000 [Mayamaea pseudoterrestris]
MLIKTCATMSAIATLRAVCNSNRGILSQKMELIDALVNKFGQEQATTVYNRQCTVVKASIGQHVRHSLDHIDRAVSAARIDSASKLIRYDLRHRGGVDESDLRAAKDRIEGVDMALQEIMMEDFGEQRIPVFDPVDACFMLSGDDATEFILPSSVARELAFAAHHAIHHLALLRIISETDAVRLELPPDFGKAPSTLNFVKDQ